MLLDRGHLVQEGAVYRPTGTIETLEVPETLHALIAARLDGLTADERHVVQNGAVLGKTFTRGGGGGADRRGRGEAGADPDRPRAQGGAVVQADPRSPEHGQYGFLQDLMRRVAYETLSMRERRARHLAAAAYLESWPGTTTSWSSSWPRTTWTPSRPSPTPTTRPRCATRAQELFVRAARRALSLGATAEAYRYYAQAAEMTDDEAEQAVLLDQAGYTAGRAGRPEDGQEAFERAIAIYERRGDTHAAARVTARLAYSLERVGQHREAIERMEAALDVIGDDEPDGDVALLTVRLGNALLFTGELDRGSELIERALDMGEALGLPEILVFGWSGKGVWMSRGRRREAQMLLQAAADLALEQGLLDRASVSLGNLSDQSFQYDAYAAALVHLDRVREIAQQAGDRPNEWFAYSERTYPLYQLGRWDEALEAFAELPEEQLSIGFTLLSPITSVVEIHIHRGELDGRARYWRCTSR